MTSHDHPLEGDCEPSCPAWAEGVLELCALKRRPDAMLAACRAAEAIEWVIVAPGTAGVELPGFLAREDFVRLNLVVGRDCPEVLLDAWGLRATLTFRGRRHDCALPWEAVKAGVLVSTRKRVRKFGVIAGGPEAVTAMGTEDAGPTPTASPESARSERSAEGAESRSPTSTSSPPPTPTPTPTPTASPTPPFRPRVPFGVIPGGKA